MRVYIYEEDRDRLGDLAVLIKLLKTHGDPYIRIGLIAKGQIDYESLFGLEIDIVKNTLLLEKELGILRIGE